MGEENVVQQQLLAEVGSRWDSNNWNWSRERPIGLNLLCFSFDAKCKPCHKDGRKRKYQPARVSARALVCFTV
jgi:hypothetical protein